uniref:Maturin n=1 Tax=Equus caballus TaxID=9796 RepID=A0A9L0RNA4_HORSE
MDFQQLADVAEKWCSNTPFELIATEETERRMDFYADPGVSFYVLCPDNGCGDNFHVWSESEDCLPFLQLAQDYISSCGKKTLHEVLEKVFKSFRPVVLEAEKSKIRVLADSVSGEGLLPRQTAIFSRYWGFQIPMTTRLKSTVQTWRKRGQRRTTLKWGSVSSKLPRAPA